MVLAGRLQEAHVHVHVGHARNFHSVSRIKAHQHNTINPENEGNTTHLTKTFALYISRVKFIRHYTLAQVICSTYFSYLQHTYKSSSIPSPTHSFIPGLKPSFSANPSHRSLSYSSPGLTTRVARRLFTDTSDHIRFLLFSFSVSTF